MNQLYKYFRGLRYRLKIIDVPCGGPIYAHGDNQSVMCNASISNSILKKKNKLIACHLVRESAAKDEWKTSYVNSYEKI